MKRTFALLGLATALLAACSSSSSTGPDAPASKPTLTITGASTAEVGTTTQLTAVATEATGAAAVNPTITWSSSDPLVIAVSGTGLVTATQLGSATITATWSEQTATFAFASTLAPYTFTFDAATTPADRQRIYEGVQYAHAFYKTTFGRVPTKPTTIATSTNAPGCVQAGGGAAFTGPTGVTICVGNPGWQQPGPLLREKIVMHELFHVIQFDMGWIGVPATGAYWLIEGTAELAGFEAMVALGKLTRATAIGCQVKEAYDFGVRQPPGLPNLSALESQPQWSSTTGPTYTIAMLGTDQLTTGRGLAAIMTYGAAVAAGTQWPQAFQTAFGTARDVFYAQFPGYRAGLPVPATYQCGG